MVENVPGVRAVALHRFSAEREIIFDHHALGRDVSTEDPALLGLTLVPLTVTMEMLAEGGALLQPGKVLVGMRDIRASRWITLEKPGYTIEATAKQTAPGEVHVALREAGASEHAASDPGGSRRQYSLIAIRIPDRRGPSRSKTKSAPPGFPINSIARACFTVP